MDNSETSKAFMDSLGLQTEPRQKLYDAVKALKSMAQGPIPKSRQKS